jgi:hypothetical protein
MFRSIVAGALALPFAFGVAVAQGKSADAPGQDRTCLVTFSKPNSTADADVVSTKWLPRKAADTQDAKDELSAVFDYENDDLVKNRTYASAQELCEKHFN